MREEKPKREIVEKTLWLIKATEKAVLYSKVEVKDPRDAKEHECVWIPKSQIFGARADGHKRVIKIPKWIAEEKGL